MWHFHTRCSCGFLTDNVGLRVHQCHPDWNISPTRPWHDLKCSIYMLVCLVESDATLSSCLESAKVLIPPGHLVVEQEATGLVDGSLLILEAFFFFGGFAERNVSHCCEERHFCGLVMQRWYIGCSSYRRATYTRLAVCCIFNVSQCVFLCCQNDALATCTLAAFPWALCSNTI